MPRAAHPVAAHLDRTCALDFAAQAGMSAVAPEALQKLGAGTASLGIGFVDRGVQLGLELGQELHRRAVIVRQYGHHRSLGKGSFLQDDPAAYDGALHDSHPANVPDDRQPRTPDCA